MIGSDFKWKTYEHSVRCSECSQKSRAMLVSERNGKVLKRLCSEECRLEFDNRFWQEAARRNANRRRP